MQREIYGYYFESEDEDNKTKKGLENITNDIMIDFGKAVSINDINEQLVAFLKQTDDAYIDKYGMVHEIYKNKDQPYAYIFEVENNHWYAITEYIGGILENEDIAGNARSAFTEIYEEVSRHIVS